MHKHEDQSSGSHFQCKLSGLAMYSSGHIIWRRGRRPWVLQDQLFQLLDELHVQSELLFQNIS